jgi:beta-galactosidase
MRSWPTRSLPLGGDYNPEQWPREVWADDVRLMREAGVTFATVGVFSWSLLEPEPGRFVTGWLDDVLDLLHANDIAVDLATATATPPAWMAQADPTVRPQLADGSRLWHGGRQAYCPSSSTYREHAVQLVELLAKRYHEHPALAMWHVNNEYACHNVPCYCDQCASAFRDWLQRRYRTVDALNTAWGTAFWSQRYTGFDQVLPPRQAPTAVNPTQLLDFRRFTSDNVLELFTAERDILHRLSPGVPVTTNFMTMSRFRHLDYFAWAPEQDVVSTDHYLVADEVDAEAELAFSADLTRGIAGGRPWILMEHSTSAVNWQRVNCAKAPGQLLRTSLNHVARGADTLGFFQWRASQAGSEKFHSALVPHAGTDTRLWREVVQLGEVCERLAEVVGTTVEADVALLWDYQAGWACDQDSHPSTLVRYGDTAHAVHRALRSLGITADVVHPDGDLSGYRVVIVPTLYSCSDAAAQRVRSAAEDGATVLVTYFSGISDLDDHIRLGGYPGAFRDLLGVWVEEFAPLLPDERVGLDDGGGLWAAAEAGLWTEHLHPVGAEVVARYTDGPLPGVPALTRNRVGAGTAWYLATSLADRDLLALMSRLVDEAGVTAPVAAPAGIELVRRSGTVDGLRRSYLFAFNHSGSPAEVTVTGHDLVGDRPVDGSVWLPSGGVAVVRERT